jgi:hypothetical protein
MYTHGIITEKHEKRGESSYYEKYLECDLQLSIRTQIKTISSSRTNKAQRCKTEHNEENKLREGLLQSPIHASRGNTPLDPSDRRLRKSSQAQHQEKALKPRLSYQSVCHLWPFLRTSCFGSHRRGRAFSDKLHQRASEQLNGGKNADLPVCNANTEKEKQFVSCTLKTDDSPPNTCPSDYQIQDLIEHLDYLRRITHERLHFCVMWNIPNRGEVRSCRSSRSLYVPHGWLFCHVVKPFLGKNTIETRMSIQWTF